MSSLATSAIISQAISAIFLIYLASLLDDIYGIIGVAWSLVIASTIEALFFISVRKY